MTSTDRLLTWNRGWRVFQGTVMCRICRAEQVETDRGSDFVHASGCPRAELRCQPWQELDEITAALRRDQE